MYRREKSGMHQYEYEADGANVPMTSCGNSESTYYNMDACDNQELPLIKWDPPFTSAFGAGGEDLPLIKWESSFTSVIATGWEELPLKSSLAHLFLQLMKLML